MKILIYNIGYSLGLNGSTGDYIFRGLRYVYCTRKIQEKVISDITTIITDTNPDICGLLEVEQGNAFFNRINQVKELNRDGKFVVDISSKYAEKSLISKIDFLRSKSNAVLLKKPLPIHKHYFGHGIKRLLYEIVVRPDISIFLVHFSLSHRARAHQIQELRSLIRQREKVVICGDFNIFGGLHELDPLLRHTHLHVVNKRGDVTFPAVHPKIALDLFLCSKSLTVKDIQVLSGAFSDHCPVLFEFETS
ncbi:endonuclease/exonuclease/phosphatase family protein [Candidatus Peregrinibacteria bacterium]|nr:MAG: endonuclease/exonuclease/phosphatase family protein [Candidatus Peregrinibacteria bacterium]